MYMMLLASICFAFGCEDDTTGLDDPNADAAMMDAMDIMDHRVPILTLHAASPSGMAAPGKNTHLIFNISADSMSEGVTLEGFLFKVKASDGRSSGWMSCGDGAGTQRFADPSLWTFIDQADPSSPLDDNLDWTFRDFQGVNCLDKTDFLRYAHLNFLTGADNGPVYIGPGETRTFALQVDTGVNSSGHGAARGDYMRISLIEEDDTDELLSNLHAIAWCPGNRTCNTYAKDILSLPLEGGELVFTQ